MSASLTETSILRRLSCASVMKPALLDDVDVLPLPPELDDDEPVLGDVPELLPDDPLDEPDDVLEPAPTVSPTEPAMAVTVPASGARSSVSASACSAVLSWSSALSTVAAADSALTADPLEPPDVEPAVEPVLVVVVDALACWSRALARLACAWATATSALLLSTRASSCPRLTCSPSLTSIFVTSPLVPKLSSSWLAGARLPLPETVDWMTPRATVTVRPESAVATGEPTTMAAMATAVAAKAERAMSVGEGRSRRVMPLTVDGPRKQGVYWGWGIAECLLRRLPGLACHPGSRRRPDSPGRVTTARRRAEHQPSAPPPEESPPTVEVAAADGVRGRRRLVFALAAAQRGLEDLLAVARVGGVEAHARPNETSPASARASWSSPR